MIALFARLIRRALASDKAVLVRTARLVLGWLLLNAPAGWRRDLADQLGNSYLWQKAKVTLHGVTPGWLERRLIDEAAAMTGDRLSAVTVSSLFRYGYEFLPDGVDWTDQDMVWRPYLSFIAFEFPPIFRSEDDQARAVAHAERLIDAAATAFARADPAQRDLIAQNFGRAYDFRPAQFTTRNLRPLTERVGALLERALLCAGHRLDHDFRPPMPGARRRIGVLVRNIERRTESFIAPAFVAGLDRTRFETMLISLAEPADAGFAGFVGQYFDRVVIIPADSIDDQAAAIRALALDLLFPANTMAAVGWSYNNLLAHRLARFQIVASIVSPMTTGLSRTDFALTAPGTEPEDIQAHYSETVLAMEGMFNCFILGEQDPRQPRPRNSATPALPGVSIRFASGGSLYKLTPELRRAWARILISVPGSELVLYPFNPGWGLPSASESVRRLFVAEFAAAGIAAHRLRLMPNQTPFQIVDLLRETDVYLDTFPYSGAASFMEPIAARCPMVGLRGVTQRGLQGAAMLEALGLSDMVAFDVEDYIAKAIDLARSPALRAAQKQRIATRLGRLPFLDYQDYGRRLTAVLDRIMPPEQTGL